MLHIHGWADKQRWKADNQKSHLTELMVNKLEMRHNVLQLRLPQVQVACWFKKAFDMQVERQQASWWIVVFVWILHKVLCLIVLAPALLCYEATQIVVHHQSCRHNTESMDKGGTGLCISLSRSCIQRTQMTLC